MTDVYSNSNFAAAIPSYKVLLIGEKGSGKTSFVKKFTTGELCKQYYPTKGVQITPIFFETNQGLIQINLWDTSGHQKSRGLREGYYIFADAAIIMFNINSPSSNKDLQNWYKQLTRICQNIPIVVVGNQHKVNGKSKIRKPSASFHCKKNLQYYQISVKTSYQFQKPLFWILKTLLNNDKLQIFRGNNKINAENQQDEEVDGIQPQEWEGAVYVELPFDTDQQFDSQ